MIFALRIIVRLGHGVAEVERRKSCTRRGLRRCEEVNEWMDEWMDGWMEGGRRARSVSDGFEG